MSQDLGSDLGDCRRDRGMEPHQTSVRKRRHRAHYRSKNGCLQCKARKVKCDEEKPKCTGCTERNTPCTYADSGYSQLARAAYGRYYNVRGGLISNGNNVVHPNSALPTTAPSPLALNMAHLQLLHHFIAFTSEALGVETITREAWKLKIPQIALSHDFLMHSVLAVAALHIAHMWPEQRKTYWERAALHQDRAVELQQDAIANASADNADALFSFSLLMIYFAFASPKASGSQESEKPLAGVIQCISIIRGVRYVVSPIQQWVEEGPLARLLSFHHPSDTKSNISFIDPDTDHYFQKFLVLCSTSSDMNKVHEFEDIEENAAAASTLRASFLKAESVADGADGALQTPEIWQWACRLTPAFLQKLGNRHPIPLVLVAHWCVILAQIRQYSWIQEWVDHTMGQIQKQLSREHHEWLEWPTKRIQEQREIWAQGGDGIGNT